MAKLRIRRLITVPLVYVLLIVGIFVLQFTQGKAFTYTNGALSVSGSYIQEEDGSQSLGLPLHLVFKGVDMYIEDSSPIKLALGTETKELFPQSLETLESGFKLGFTDDSTLTFNSEKRGDIDVLSVLANLPKNAKSLTLPYKTVRSAYQEEKNNILLVYADNQQFVFSGIVDTKEEVLQFTPSSPTIAYRTFIPSKGVEIASLAKSPMASQSIYSENLDRFASTSVATIRSALNSSYTEKDVAVFISEMAKNGNYKSAISALPVAFTAGSTKTYETNTFFGNLVKTTEKLVSDERDSLTKISRLITEQNSEVFEFDNLIAFLLDRTSAPLFNDLVKFASTINTEKITPLQAAGILKAMVDTNNYRPEMQNPFTLLQETCLRIITNSLVEVGDAAYISLDDKKVDAMTCLKAGTLLIEYGNKTSNAEWASIGRLLVSSILRFMNERGNLPATLNFTLASDKTTKAGLIPEATRILKPSDVYSTLIKNTYYPHAESLSKIAGAGVWAWTSANSIIVKKPTEKEISFIVKYPAGEAHYLIIRGIKPFTSIQIYGINYRSDPRFETYNSSGYIYNEATQTLYLKLLHKSENETVKLSYEPIKAEEPKPVEEEKPEVDSAEITEEVTTEEPTTPNETETE